jgi:hypothetical protein
MVAARFRTKVRVGELMAMLNGKLFCPACGLRDLIVRRKHSALAVSPMIVWSSLSCNGNSPVEFPL